MTNDPVRQALEALEFFVNHPGVWQLCSPDSEVMRKARAALESTPSAPSDLVRRLIAVADLRRIEGDKDEAEVIEEALAALASSQVAEPVAVVGSGFQLLWTGSESFAEHARKHGITVGTKLYTHPPLQAGQAAQSAEKIDQLVFALTQQRPKFEECETAEPCLVNIIHDYYRAHFSDLQAHEYTSRYLSLLSQLAQALASPTQEAGQAGQEGWKCVPVAPTPQMIQEVESAARMGAVWTAESVYKAMVSAAPPSTRKTAG